MIIDSRIYVYIKVTLLSPDTHWQPLAQDHRLPTRNSRNKQNKTNKILFAISLVFCLRFHHLILYGREMQIILAGFHSVSSASPRSFGIYSTLQVWMLMLSTARDTQWQSHWWSPTWPATCWECPAPAPTPPCTATSTTTSTEKSVAPSETSMRRSPHIPPRWRKNNKHKKLNQNKTKSIYCIQCYLGDPSTDICILFRSNLANQISNAPKKLLCRYIRDFCKVCFTILDVKPKNIWEIY